MASNSEVSTLTTSFLRGILKTLQGLDLTQSEDPMIFTEAEISQRCIEYSIRRVKTYHNFMQKYLRQCLATLRGSEDPEEEILISWLESFQGFENNLPGLCHFAYQERSCQCMRALQRHIGDNHTYIVEGESRRQAFVLTRHYIGRLGSHVRAAKVLVAAGLRMPDLFNSFAIQTRPAPKPPSLPPPTGHLTTLEGILNRMLPPGSEKAPLYQEALATLNAKFNIQTRLQDKYQDKHFRPRVHAELNLLEYFHAKRLPFVDDDRFIGCSKPACYCCYHYISNHPGGFVRPTSHSIRYMNWRPPDLINNTDSKEKIQQRDVLNKVIAQIRLDTLRHIERQRGPSMWRPDSTTGITCSETYNGPVNKTDTSQSDNMDTLNHPKPGLATTHTSARSSPRISASDKGGDELADHNSCSQEEQDSESEGGVLLT
ncbi:hypothetical protein VC83_08458 [Pseudogymnoascus destructans]|uniref:Uncharacterized protein n=2 Tax=Pseudogymnoascus destructans TaxID=655981 RepID=L8FQI5_PSED2|nr:uncharacterized protein VC83_08458 [Pseudogymnoascus destructans]ELR03152.1 hypothetical protein GMDG_05981 [Pseudogymnoascus destructans 20631-21]OAF55137.1 hypothetical protein VC83_08458 [Pseudogymnoascus destructans]